MGRLNDYLGGIIGNILWQVTPGLFATFRLRDAGYRPSLAWLIVAYPFTWNILGASGVDVPWIPSGQMVFLMPSALAALALIPRSRAPAT